MRCLAADQRAQAGDQLALLEGLGQVVIGTQLQAQHAVDRVTTGRQHQDAQAWMGLAPAPAQRHAAGVGQHHVQQYHVGWGVRQGALGLRGREGGLRLPAFVLQQAHQHGGQLGVVIDDEDRGLGQGSALWVRGWAWACGSYCRLPAAWATNVRLNATALSQSLRQRHATSPPCDAPLPTLTFVRQALQLAPQPADQQAASLWPLTGLVIHHHLPRDPTDTACVAKHLGNPS